MSDLATLTEMITKGNRNEAKRLTQKLLDFDIQGRITQVHPGPVVTMFEFEPAPGVKVSRIVNLSDDLALAMKAASVRIQSPLPGKAAVGIEVPNDEMELVTLREILEGEAFYPVRYVPTISRPNDPRNAGWTGRTGRVEQVVADTCRDLGLRGDRTVVYICGNPEMILNVERVLMDRNFPEFHVKKELYWPKGKTPGAEAPPVG